MLYEYGPWQQFINNNAVGLKQHTFPTEFLLMSSTVSEFSTQLNMQATKKLSKAKIINNNAIGQK